MFSDDVMIDLLIDVLIDFRNMFRKIFGDAKYKNIFEQRLRPMIKAMGQNL